MQELDFQVLLFHNQSQTRFGKNGQAVGSYYLNPESEAEGDWYLLMGALGVGTSIAAYFVIARLTASPAKTPVTADGPPKTLET